MITASAVGAQAQQTGDTLVLDLGSAILMAQRQSPEAQQARSNFLAEYWQYRSFRANYLPSLSVSSSPYLNKEINKITMQDGSEAFIKQDLFGADISMQLTQNLALTGGSFFVKSNLSRLDDLRNNTTSYSAQPLLVGYQQSLFGYNALKWDKRIEPVRFSAAKKEYAETLELISAQTCNRFFALAGAITSQEMAKENFATSDTLYRMAKGRYEIGTISQNEMLQLEINKLQDETRVMDAEIILQDQMQSFRSFLGLSQTTPIKLNIPDSVPEFQVEMEKALSLALEHSPDPEQFSNMVMQSKSNLAYAKANRGLKADIYLQLGLSQTGPDIPTAYQDPNNQMRASVTLALPILDWGRGKGRVKVAESQLETATTRAQQGMRDFEQNIQKLVMQFNMQGKKVNVASLTNKRAESRSNVATKLYMMGQSSILDLNSAINEKNNARNNYINTMSEYWRLYYTIRSITGYDFEHDTEIENQVIEVLK